MYFRSLTGGLVSFLGGVLIDLDHVLDYYVNNGFTLKIRDVYNGCCDAVGLRKIYLFLHSYELLAIFWAIIFITTPGNIWVALAIGVTQHMIVDTITNRLAPFGYMFTYRAKKGFEKDFILKTEGRQAQCLP